MTGLCDTPVPAVLESLFNEVADLTEDPYIVNFNICTFLHCLYINKAFYELCTSP